MSIVGGSAGHTWRTLLVAAVVLATTLLPVAGSATPGSGPAPGAQQGQRGAGDKKTAESDEPPVWTGVPGTNLAHDSYGYPWPAAPDCNEADVSSGGCVNDGLGFFQGQCTSWVAFRLGQRNGVAFSNWFGGAHWGNAVDWARVAKRLGFQRNKVPAVGSIGWYGRGHVSYVEDVNSDGSVVISEMNTDGHNGFHLVTTYPGGPGYPDKFIHVADVVPVDYTAPDRPTPAAARHLDRGVSLSWRAPADDIGVTGYQVLRNGVPLAETTEPRYVDRQASAGQAYAYTVVASDAAGNVSEPATASLGQTVPFTGRRSGQLREATEVTTSTGTAVCGRLGTQRRPHVGCRVRTLEGWHTVRTGRSVPWGAPGTRAFVAAAEGTQLWFCRELPGRRNGCLPLDLTSLSWGFDRIDRSRPVPAYAVWLGARTGPTRCGMVGDRPSCSVLQESGWKGARKVAVRPGDPLSRAFVRVRDGVAFCRVVDGRAMCTTLATGRLGWQRSVTDGRNVAHGRWSSRRAGPVLCPVGGGGCRVLGRQRG